METAIHVNEELEKIYSEYGVPEGYKIGDMNKRDFERYAYYRAKNRIDKDDKEKIDVYNIILQDICGDIGVAAANMILFRLGIFLTKMDVRER